LPYLTSWLVLYLVCQILAYLSSPYRIYVNGKL